MPAEPFPPDSGRTREIIARSQPLDYDGHTEFDRLSPGPRLAWLDQAVEFIEAVKRQTTKTNESPVTFAPWNSGRRQVVEIQ